MGDIVGSEYFDEQSIKEEGDDMGKMTRYKVPFENYTKVEAGIMYVNAKSKEEAIKKAQEDYYDDIEVEDQSNFHIDVIEEDVEEDE